MSRERHTPSQRFTVTRPLLDRTSTLRADCAGFVSPAETNPAQSNEIEAALLAIARFLRFGIHGARGHEQGP